MVPLTPGELTPAIIGLFDPARPTMLRAFQVLAGLVRGEILLDDPAGPTWAAVYEPTFSTIYLGGQLDAAPLPSLVQRFRAPGGVGIGCWPDEPLAAMLPPDPAYDGPTLLFDTRSPAADLRALQDRLPPGYRLAPRDAALLPQSPDYASTLAAFGSVERILHLTRGVAVLSGAKVVCEAATGAATLGQIEVGVTTDAEHRGRGLATAACAALIAACEAEGLATWWDCAAQNIASARLARRLGYRRERTYRYVWWGQR